VKYFWLDSVQRNILIPDSGWCPPLFVWSRMPWIT
jgi:hypothetical protein